MPFRFHVQENLNLALVIFHGHVTPEEEAQAVIEFARLPGVKPDTAVLVDRRHAPMAVLPEHVTPHIDLIQQHFEVTDSRPRMAIVAPSDFDFGMARMLQLQGGDQLPHDMMAVRTIEDACAWLRIAPDAIEWPSMEEPG